MKINFQNRAPNTTLVLFAEKKRMSSTQNKKGPISGYVKHIRSKTPEIWGVL